MVNEPGLEYRKIYACPYHYMLYYNDENDRTECFVCKHLRFKPKSIWAHNAKDVPLTMKRYFSMVSTLQCLFMSKNIAPYMQ